RGRRARRYADGRWRWPSSRRSARTSLGASWPSSDRIASRAYAVATPRMIAEFRSTTSGGQGRRGPRQRQGQYWSGEIAPLAGFRLGPRRWRRRASGLNGGPDGNVARAVGTVDGDRRRTRLEVKHLLR